MVQPPSIFRDFRQLPSLYPKAARFRLEAAPGNQRAIDLYRRKQRHPEVALEEAALGLQIEYTGENGIAKCIGQLPARYRHVLVLKHLHGFNNREVAKIFKTTETNVAKLYHRAKTRLRELCQKEEIL